MLYNKIVIYCQTGKMSLSNHSIVIQCVTLFTLVVLMCGAHGVKRDFVIDYQNNTFLKDGVPFRYISGSIHYARIPHYYWKDRLQKMYAAGLDAVQTYVPWNVHESMPGEFTFEQQNDLVHFLQLAHETGLLVILRMGPYICAEWDYGGFPAWIKQNNNSVVLRSMDPGYIPFVDRWLSVLLPKMKPLLYTEGGPIIMVQIENEYGSYQGVACDHNYMMHLRDLSRKYLGDDVVLFTTDGDGDGYLRCGAVDGAYATVDFGPGGNVTASFEIMKNWNKRGPLVNSEFYTGWLDAWGGPHTHTDINAILKSMKEILDSGASVNMYMFEGGTDFGYMSGALPPFKPSPTSYDYDAPMSEAGDTTSHYWAIRDLISKYKTLPSTPVPPNTPKYEYGDIKMQLISTVLEALKVLCPSGGVLTHYPSTMEQLGWFHGFMLYRHVITADYPTATLSVAGLRDRGYVLLDGMPQGMLDRNTVTSLNLLTKNGQVLDIIVENQGRINYGAQINDNFKGILSNVSLGGVNLTSWTHYPLNFSEVDGVVRALSGWKPRMGNSVHQLQPAMFRGTFVVPQHLPSPQDTFLKMCGWYKGQAFVNGFNLGRYWPSVGPQVTLFIPKGVLRAHPLENDIVMVELESSPCHGHASTSCYVQLVKDPIISSRCFKPGQDALPSFQQQVSRYVRA